MSVSGSSLVNSTRQKDTLTENGAITNSTTLSNVLDLFFLAGASRNLPELDVEILILKSMAEDELSTLKVIFWAGDIRGGAGERRFFKIALKTLSNFYPAIFAKNFALAPEFNRFDSLFDFYDNQEVMTFLAEEVYTKKNSLLAKWMPREGKVKNQEFRKAFLKHMDITPKQYRQMLTRISNTLETNLSNKDYSFKYLHVPSVAFNKYRKAFYRNDEARIIDFIDKVESGEEKINAGAIFPYDIYRSFDWYNSTEDQNKSINAQWAALPNYMEGSDERILPVCDVSGSMHGLPIEISVSLGVYISERNKSVFKDAFITFSERPQMNYLQGTTTQRFQQLGNADWGMNTNLQATFNLILNSALREGLTQDDMPTKLLIISDMEFDRCARGGTSFDNIRKDYADAGYKMPDIVFWNVNGRSTSNFPVAFNEEGVALVSGASPSILKSVLNGSLDPMTVLNDTINAERYNILKV